MGAIGTASARVRAAPGRQDPDSCHHARMPSTPSDLKWLRRADVITTWTWIIGVPAVVLWVFAPVPEWLALLIPALFIPAYLTPGLIRVTVNFRQGYRGD